jgi:N-acetylglucosamine-6-sulfatase
MRNILFSFIALATMLHAAPQRPNIVFIFSDDHSPNAISAYPGGVLDKVAPTPNIDRLAAQGAVFARSYCCNSICGPSRAAIITGKHSHVNGFLDNQNSWFDGSQTTFPKLLRKAGYQTAMIGKWHLISNPRGFDYWEILPGQGNYYNPDFLEQKGGRKHYQGYTTDIITGLALDWLKTGRDKDKPFLLMCQHKAPHRSWSPPPRYYHLFDGVKIPEPGNLFDDYANRSVALKQQEMEIGRNMTWEHDMKFHGPNLFPKYFAGRMKDGEYKRMTPEQQKAWDAAYEPKNQKFIADMKAGKFTPAEVVRWKYQRYMKNYLACIRAVDDGVGKLLDYLDESGLAKNTIVIYSSDQGFYLGEHGWFDKRWMFEESYMMPFIARWPGTVKPGTVSKALIQNIDYAPTFLEIAGAPIPPTVQGRSLVPVLKAAGGKTPDDWRDALYYFYSGENCHHVAAHDGVSTERYKLMFFPKTKEWNLFDLEKDPREMRSVHDDPAYAAVLAQMKKRYAELRTKYMMSPATLPAARMNLGWWKKRHEAKVAEARKGGHDLVFIGDSITHSWENSGKKVWNEFYGKRHALNLGFSGDRTEHVLWRLMNHELENVSPKAYVVMIGTNNTGHRQEAPEETAAGIRLIVDLLRDRTPDAKILLLGVFPRGAKPTDKLRKINDSINEIIKTYDDGKHVKYLDINEMFLTDDGTLPKEIMPDLLHPKEQGYRLWAQSIEPELKRMGL